MEQKMSEQQYQEMAGRYFAMADGLDYFQIDKKLAAMPENAPDKDEFEYLFLNEVFDAISLGYLRYDKKHEILDPQLYALIERMAKRRPKPFISAFLAMLKHRRAECVEGIKNSLKPSNSSDLELNEINFAQIVLEPFKNSIPNLYSEIRTFLDTIPAEESVKDICSVLDAYYEADSPDAQVDILTPVVRKHPDSTIAVTLLAYAHYEAKRWGNAIACFEQVESSGFPLLFTESDIYFFKGWAYSRLKEHKNAVKNYEEAVDANPYTPFALNNLGYELYLLKRYPKALETFERCLAEKIDERYAVNNYLRTLLAMKRYQDARDFAAHPPVKLAKDLLKRLDNADDGADSIFDEQEVADELNEIEESIEKKLDPNKDKAGQFYSEKLLEDELTLRIEAGIPVFGRKLKIYRRFGEYGRQYIIPIGRLDLLAEDDDGNLYIIELKKDSGYDDAYAQTAAYLDWFEKNKKVKGKIYGIICLNSPTDKLKAAVRRDDRVRLFNYTISYDEVK